MHEVRQQVREAMQQTQDERKREAVLGLMLALRGLLGTPDGFSFGYATAALRRAREEFPGLEG